MNLQQLIFQNNFTKLIIIIFVTTFISLNAQSEIPEKYKIDSSLAKCKGTDYKNLNNDITGKIQVSLIPRYLDKTFLCL